MAATVKEVRDNARREGPENFYFNQIDYALQATKDGNAQRARQHLEAAKLTAKVFSLRFAVTEVL